MTNISYKNNIINHVDTACVIIGSIKAINGDPWRYPLTLKLIK